MSDEKITTWYYVCKWVDEVRPIEVHRETETSVWIKGKVYRKHSEAGDFYPTSAEAANRIIDYRKAELESAELRVNYCKQRLHQSTLALMEHL